MSRAPATSTTPPTTPCSQGRAYAAISPISGSCCAEPLQIPARFAAVYAPGLTPMDFHAVFEAWFDGAWWTYDATRRAPREGMVRIATGRDAADTAFLNVLRGIIALRSIEVTATVTGLLPIDDDLATYPLR